MTFCLVTDTKEAAGSLLGSFFQRHAVISAADAGSLARGPAICLGIDQEQSRSNYRSNPIAWVVVASVVIAAIAAVFYSTGNHTTASNQPSAPTTKTTSTNPSATTGSGAVLRQLRHPPPLQIPGPDRSSQVKTPVACCGLSSWEASAGVSSSSERPR